MNSDYNNNGIVSRYSMEIFAGQYWAHDRESGRMVAMCVTEAEAIRVVSALQNAQKISALTDALEQLLPHHSLACVVWENGAFAYEPGEDLPLVTEQSCQCSAETKDKRRLLQSLRRSQKGFAPRSQQTSPAESDTDNTTTV